MSDLQDRFEITQDGEKREIFMSFGLLNEITALMGEPATAASVYFAPKLREQVLLSALHDRAPSGKIKEQLVSLDDVEISASDMEALLAWEVDHAIGFFTRSMDRVVKLKGALEGLNQGASSLTGSPVSPSKKR
ncbi:hypothetical protein [Mesorhizobium sp. M7A.F.Ca.MR.362.00.0.0]|uniref:hypothetical protein n=1 Tax=Mesorhizobium sp. M7A.F.Ca.MR.362.00.0.0 TaxID=2496779 RepID=UPI000FD3C6D9|nr:hypothetical protein [Mesorhizobium sp. M7A.F.Ca.MR.362.00.0.0]RUU78133.1 hypothetical protein EOC06_20980 [Mesorhizobium sp. M7A.F.Ca.MR.362.00.0.0]RWN95450.1 MAG: hypothetical protein EOS05_11695 [Mesorhizobium sp.]